jgi:hypothetical protein
MHMPFMGSSSYSLHFLERTGVFITRLYEYKKVWVSIYSYVEVIGAKN